VIMRANDNEPLKSSKDFADVMGGLSTAKELQGLLVYGHGGDDHFGTGQVKYDSHGDKTGSYNKSPGYLSVTYADITNSLKYKLGFVLINACHSKAGADSLKSGNGIAWGFENRSSPLDPDTTEWLGYGKTEQYHRAGDEIKPPQEGTGTWSWVTDPWW